MLPLPFPLSVAGWETGMVRRDAVLCGKSNSWYRESVVRTIHFCLAEITTELTLLDVEATDKEIPQGQTIADIAGWKGEDAKGWRTVAEAFSANIFIWGFLFFLLQERYRLRTARKQTKGSTSVWPPTPKACATLLPPTYTCEVGPETQNTHARTRTNKTQTPKNHCDEGALGITSKTTSSVLLCSLTSITNPSIVYNICWLCCLVFLTTTFNKSTLNLGASSDGWIKARIKWGPHLGLTAWKHHWSVC